MEWIEFKNELSSEFLSKHIHTEFWTPLNEYLKRKRKNFRGQLVELGIGLGLRSVELVSDADKEAVIRAIELLHAGTLILDDIQDDSMTRRGLPSLHRQMGVPRALNLGSWTFFAAQKIVNDSGLKAEQKKELLDCYRETLYWGHIGQSIDLAIEMSRVPQHEVLEVVDQSHRYKTGVVTSLALVSGCILSSSTPAQQQRAFVLGEALGVLLQKIDDLKNLRPDQKNPDKQYEDLKNLRPSFVWSWASRQTDGTWSSLQAAVSALLDVPESERAMPEAAKSNRTKIDQWVIETGILARAMTEIQADADALVNENRDIAGPLKTLIAQLIVSYENQC